MNNNISFIDGFQKVSINGDIDRCIRWNPSDVGFVDRFLSFQDWVENDFTKRLNAIHTMLGGTEDEDGGANNFSTYERGSLNALGTELNKALDDAFGCNVSEKAFQGVHPLSPTDNGSLLFMNFLEALMPVIEKSIDNFKGKRKQYTDPAKTISKAKLKVITLKKPVDVE